MGSIRPITSNGQVSCPACDLTLQPPVPHKCGPVVAVRPGRVSVAEIEQELSEIAEHLRDLGQLPVRRLVA